MRKRSTYVVLAGGVFALLALLVGTAAFAGSTPPSCQAKKNCAAADSSSGSGSSTSQSADGGGSGGSTVTPKAPKAPKPPAPVPPMPGSKPPSGGGSGNGGGGGSHGGGNHGGGSGGGGGGGGGGGSGGGGGGGGGSGPSGPTRTSGGSPTPAAPGYFDGSGGKDPLTGAPKSIDQFRIPLFLLPIYQAAGANYSIRWEYLAAINEIETNYGRNLNTSSAGAVGWMQFMPATWKQYGVDANHDGRKDPYNPVDAIFAAARYLKAAGGDKNIRKGIYAYNHASWYVDSVIMRARLIAGLSPDLIGSLTGLAEARFPLRGPVKYADDPTERAQKKSVKPGQNPTTSSSDPNRKSIRIFGKKGSPVIAVNDGIVKKIGESKELGRFVVLQDDFGNQYTYANLASVSADHPVPKEDVQKEMEAQAAQLPAGLRVNDPRPTQAATAGRQSDAGGGTLGALNNALGTGGGAAGNGTSGTGNNPPVVKERLFAYPNRANSFKNGGAQQLAAARQGDPLDLPNSAAAPGSLSNYFLNTRGFNSKDFRLVPLREGSRVLGDTILGRIGDGSDGSKTDPNLSFAIRPAGKNAPQIDPKPIIDGWKLLEATQIFQGSGKNVLQGDTAIGQVLLMSKSQLQQRILADRRIEIYPCGRKDIQTGQIDRRVLAAIAYLTESGLRPTISMLKCGHSYLTVSGNVSEHISGNAVDISRLNGEPVLGHQQKGGLTYQAIKRLQLLQGTMKPHQIISLINLGPPTLVMADHADHLHIGYRPAGDNGKGGVSGPVLKASDWYKLIDQLGKIDNPAVATRPSKASIPDKSNGD